MTAVNARASATAAAPTAAAPFRPPRPTLFSVGLSNKAAQVGLAERPRVVAVQIGDEMAA